MPTERKYSIDASLHHDNRSSITLSFTLLRIVCGSSTYTLDHLQAVLKRRGFPKLPCPTVNAPNHDKTRHGRFVSSTFGFAMAVPPPGPSCLGPGISSSAALWPSDSCAHWSETLVVALGAAVYLALCCSISLPSLSSSVQSAMTHRRAVGSLIVIPPLL